MRAFDFGGLSHSCFITLNRGLLLTVLEAISPFLARLFMEVLLCFCALAFIALSRRFYCCLLVCMPVLRWGVIRFCLACFRS